MGIRGFGSLFGDQQSGDVANVGIDLFFDMLFDSLSKVSSFIRSHITNDFPSFCSRTYCNFYTSYCFVPSFSG
jgi:transcription-repair coupling factor (superfamily II helicase)